MDGKHRLTAELVGYRLTRAEWEVLRLLLTLPDTCRLFQFPLDEAAERQAVEQLTELGLLTPGRDNTLVDELFAFMVESLSEAFHMLSIESVGHRLALCQCPSLAMLAEQDAKHMTLTPLPDAASGAELLLRGLERLPVPRKCFTGAPGEALMPVVTFTDADDPESARFLRQILEDFTAPRPPLIE